MLLLPLTFGRGKPLLICIAGLVLAYLGSSCVDGASLREHRLRGAEAELSQAPDADMLKALEYIENLRQRSSLDSPRRQAGYSNAERLRAALRLVSDPREVEEEEHEGEQEEREDKSEELLQAVLSTLQQSEKATQPQRYTMSDGTRQKQHGITPHKKLPLMFENDEEEGEEGGEGDEEEDDDVGPFKRTNENVEEKYTPQNLATLQSVFNELDKLTAHKRLEKEEEEGEEEAREEGEGEEDMFEVRNVEYNDEDGLAEWSPEKEPTVEEEDEDEDDRQELERSVDYMEDQEEEEEEEDEEGRSAKRSTEPDDVTKLVDFYILKVLEKSEEEEKRAIKEDGEEQQQRAERRAGLPGYRGNFEPREVYQLLRILQKYQIPPKDFMEMLKTGTGSGLNSRRLMKESLSKKLYSNDARNILGLAAAATARQTAPGRRQRLHKISTPRLSASRTGHYGDSVDEDELAAYLAARMLARHPKGSQKRGAEAGQEATRENPLENAMLEYLEQMDSEHRQQDDKRGNETRDSEDMMTLLNFLDPDMEDDDSQ